MMAGKGFIKRHETGSDTQLTLETQDNAESDTPLFKIPRVKSLDDEEGENLATVNKTDELVNIQGTFPELVSKYFL
ncbi:hypothetical protein AX774_g7145 [Zancudomyces culisetae]|uniref:Uncharacterized protein n=1 Tax=Zancudomyces culisetae TaxID=1213189 RepID=A0A1R1PEL6_ZANCU|nr:hypothetical protein AX774_g7145 [Zancudomyces culisetae]|eukprot:OMH79445.1 hypothetical protein AX774_g7145 [Zancudomyces culisetae]